MKVILKADVKGSGKAGDLINVSDGYARNFLFPKKLAVAADNASINEYKSKEDAKAHHKLVELQNAEATAALLNNKEIFVTAKAGQGGKLFGSVTSKEVSIALKKQFDLDIDKRKIVMSDIKAFGTFEGEVKIHAGVSAKIRIVVSEQ